LLLFIILTMSLGIFSANSVQTINRNLNDYIMYNGSSDMIIVPYEKFTMVANPDQNSDIVEKPIFSVYKNLEGVDSVSIISIAKYPQIYANMQQSADNLKMIGIDPITDSDVIWSRADMFDLHINHYINMLEKNPDNCIISENLANDMGLKAGDTIEVNKNSKGFGAYSLKVSAIVDRWPSYIYTNNKDGEKSLDQLIITNSTNMESKFKDVLYQVLLKTDKDATVESIKKQLADNFMPLQLIYDYKADIAASRNSAERQSMNAMLSFCFLIIFALVFRGFILYWIFSFNSRIL